MARPRIVSDQEILDAARRLFLERGPHVPTKVIAEAVGLSQPALFKRFGTKERLMLDSLLPRDLPFLPLVEAGPDAREAKVQLIEIGLEVSRFFDRMLPCLMTLRAASEQTVAQMFMEMKQPPPLRTKDALVGWLTRAHARGLVHAPDPEALASAFLGGLQAGAFHAHLTTTPRTEDRLRAAVTSLVNTLHRGMQPRRDEKE